MVSAAVRRSFITLVITSNGVWPLIDSFAFLPKPHDQECGQADFHHLEQMQHGFVKATGPFDMSQSMHHPIRKTRSNPQRKDHV